MARTPKTPAFWMVLAALVYDVMPIDLIPDALPVVGFADDLGVTGLLLLAAGVWWRRRKAAEEPSATTA